MGFARPNRSIDRFFSFRKGCGKTFCTFFVFEFMEAPARRHPVPATEPPPDPREAQDQEFAEKLAAFRRKIEDRDAERMGRVRLPYKDSGDEPYNPFLDTE